MARVNYCSFKLRVCLSVVGVFAYALSVSAVYSDFSFRNLVADQNTVAVSNGDINFGLITTNHMSSGSRRKCDTKFPVGCAAGLESLKFALSRLNERPDVLPNITVGYVAVDDCGSAQRALEGSIVFVNDILQTSQVGNCSHTASTVTTYAMMWLE
jgi:hypothetical protein